MALFLAFFVIYQLSFAATIERPLPDHWFFGADSYRISFDYILDRHPMAIYQTKKHSLYVAVATPIYQIGKLLYAPLPPVLAGNLALSFPGALFGAANVLIAWFVFVALGISRARAIWPTLFYALAPAVWAFASIPETYIFAALLANLFLLLCLRDVACKNWTRLAVVNAAGAFVAPQQIFLAAIPIWRALFPREGPRRIRLAASYGLLVSGLFLPAFLFLQWFNFSLKFDRPNIGFTTYQLHKWAKIENLVEPEHWLSVGTTMLAKSQIAFNTDPDMLAELSWARFLGEPPLVVVLTLALAVCVLVGMVLGVRSGNRAKAGVAAYLVVGISFFVYFNPPETFLHSGPFVLPIWVLVHAGLLRYQDRRAWTWALVGGVALLVYLNARMTHNIVQHPDEFYRDHPYTLEPPDRSPHLDHAPGRPA